MPDEPQPHAETTLDLDTARTEDPSAALPPAPRESAALDDLDELEDTIPGRPMAQLLARHTAASAADEESACATPGMPPAELATAASDSAVASSADEASVTLPPPPTLDGAAAPSASAASAVRDEGDTATLEVAQTDDPGEPDGAAGAAGLDAASGMIPAGDAETPAPPAVSEASVACTAPELDRDAYAAARTQPELSIPQVAAPTEPMPPTMRDAAVPHPPDSGAQPGRHTWQPSGSVQTPPTPPATQITPRLGMPPIDALAASGHGSGNGHHADADPAPRPERARPARPRMVDVSGVHSRVPPEYWLDDDPIEETRLSLGLRGTPAVKTEAGRPLPQPRRFKRAPRWLTILVLVFVTAAVAACVGGAVAVANIYLQHSHTTAPVPASTAAPTASPTAPKR